MKHLTRWLFAALLLLAAGAAVAQDAAVTLTPFTDNGYEIQGVIPDGWTKAGPGIYGRAPGTADVTLLALQAAPLPASQLLQALLPQLLLTEAPESVGTRDTATFTWTLYQVDVNARGVTVKVDLALAEQAGKTYVALLQTSPDDYEALHDSVFLPVLDAYQPLTAAVTPEDVPYVVEEVTFDNGDVTLAGTLTLPEGDGPFPAVVLVTGSGGQDRDESLAPLSEIKPFRLIADHLTRSGIAVLRYDDRGIGQSTGDFAAATTVDFATDAAAAVDYLLSREEINAQQVGVLGHSEGGIITAMLGASNEHVAFLISFAGTAVSGQDLLLTQSEQVLRLGGASQEQIDLQLNFLRSAFPLLEANDKDAFMLLARETLLKSYDLLPEDERAAYDSAEDYADQTGTMAMEQMTSDWYRGFIAYNPADDWAKTTVPVLAIFGGLDAQVDAAQNAPAIEAALQAAGNEDVTVVTIPGMNHLGQAAVTGGVEEYGTLEPNFTPELLETITSWLLARVDAAGE